MHGQCKQAWDNCLTGFYTGCCTQDKGPKTMDVYCDQLGAAAAAGTSSSFMQTMKKNTTDKACKVDGMMKGVNTQLKRITTLVIKINQAQVDAANVTSQDSIAIARAPGPATAPAPATDDEKASQTTRRPDDVRRSDERAMPLAIAPLIAASPADGIVSYPDFAFAPAPAYMIASSPATASTSAPLSLAAGCKQLRDLAKNVADRIALIRKWAKQDGMDKDVGEKQVKDMAKATKDAEAKDPDLAFSLSPVLKLGKKLDAMLAKNHFCTSVDDDYDDEADDSDEDDTEEQDIDEDEAKEQGKVEANTTAILELLEFDSQLQLAVDNFETQVHPHGIKWWRYRYEYTIVESFVLAYAVVVLYIIKWLVFKQSFFEVQRFHRTGLIKTLYRYAFVYFIFQAACVWIMVLTAYVLYMPWGEKNVFNLTAKALHWLLNDTFRVPYLGSSWLFLILDVQFQLFATYCLYACFVAMVARTYISALQDWKAIEQGEPPRYAANQELFDKFHDILLMRVENTKDSSHNYLDIFRKRKLRLKGCKQLADQEGKEMSSSSLRTGAEEQEEVDDENPPARNEDWYDFKLHLYLTEGLGKSLHYLVQVSLVTNVWLAVCALVVAVLAHFYQLAFMYLLPPFVITGIIILLSGYFLSRHYISLSEDLDHDRESKFVTSHNYCRAIQVILYCMFYSFARLLLSTDIFEHYPNVYLSALLVLLLILLALAVVGGEVMKAATCALILPPHISDQKFSNNLDNIQRWHTIINCHQCGVFQRSEQNSFSMRWAGQTKGSPPPSARSNRSGGQSFR
jgi:hypothetical protein